MKRTLSFLLATSLCLSVLSFAPAAVSCGGKSIEKYDVTVTSTFGGTLTADTKSVEQGKDVTFTIEPNEGYMLESLTVNGGNVTVS